MTRFVAGESVRVLALDKKGHVRIPHYVRGQVGTVERYCGTYLNPEELAFGNTSGPAIDLYRVAFSLGQLWPDERHPIKDRLIIEIYDHWLTHEQETTNAP